MAISKTITIDGMEVPFRASATLPRIYRYKFRRDLMHDMSVLEDDQKAYEEAKEAGQETHGFSLQSLEIFEDIAYCMALHAADPSQPFPTTPDEWLEQFKMLSIYEVLPELLEMWGLNMETQAQPKKK